MFLKIALSVYLKLASSLPDRDRSFAVEIWFRKTTLSADNGVVGVDVDVPNHN